MNVIHHAGLGWYIAAFVIAGFVAGRIWSWFGDRYEITWHGPFPARVTRRWYGAGAHVVLRTAVDDDQPDRFAVLDWWADGPAVPWLWVIKLDPEYLTYWDEDAKPFWAPVTDFAPYTVRRIRPYFYRFGKVWLPWLTKYLPVRNPSRYLEGAR